MNGREQARLLHSAMSSILDAHHKQKRSLSTELVSRDDSATANADVVMSALVDAVIDAAEVENKKWMKMLAIGAVSKTVRESVQAGTAGDTELPGDGQDV